jgi:HD-GYP domain-containing protein (c-di-GMP phosphodiesterase class II)
VITSRHLDKLLNPARPSLHRALLARIVPLWLLLSVVAGLSAYLVESSRMEQFIIGLSNDAVQRFEDSTPAGIWSESKPQQEARLTSLLQQTPFVGVRLFDAGRHNRIESWRVHEPGLSRQPDAFPGSEGHRQSIMPIGDRIYVQTLVPLLDARHVLYGYFQGSYLVPASTMRTIRARIRAALIGVLLSVGLSTLAIYPVIVSLNRDAVRLSHNLLASNVELMRVLGNAIAKRDSDTDSHNYRVTLYAVDLAESLRLPSRQIIALMAGAFLHDVGKIGISDSILLKPGALTDEEFTRMREHVNIGLQIIGEVKWLELAEEVVACHHERFDGSGYPRGLQGRAIPYNARLFAIIDVFDALTSVRPYKQAFTLETTLDMMRAERGSHFDPELLDHFIARAETLYARYHQADTATLRHRLAAALGKYFRQQTGD